jgi:hypothetical protein
MERLGHVPARWPGRWSWARRPAVAAALLLVERELVGLAGTPAAQFGALRQAGLIAGDPVAPTLAILALVAEALVGYLLVVLVLESLGLLPGSVGRFTRRTVELVSPGVVRKLLDLLVGGALLAQATVVALPDMAPGQGPAAIHRTARPAALVQASATGAVAGSGLVEARPSPRRSAVPLPPWLGGGPSTSAPTRSTDLGCNPRNTDPGNTDPPDADPGNTARSTDPGHTVEPGDTLWGIAAAHLAQERRSLPAVDRYWQQIYRANRPVIGADPDLIHPGTHLDLPPPGDNRP